MDHLTDKQLLGLLEQPEGYPALREHMAACASCAAKLQALKEPWDVLGQWTLEPRGVDLTDRILARVHDKRAIYIWEPRALLRIAASIVIGVGAGAWLGKLAAPPVSDQQAADAMYLDALALNSSTGWNTPWLQDGQE